MTMQQFLKIYKKVAERFQYARAFKWGWHQQNTPKSCNYIVLRSYTLSKLYVDIKFDIFNVKFKNHLFYLMIYLFHTICPHLFTSEESFWYDFIWRVYLIIIHFVKLSFKVFKSSKYYPRRQQTIFRKLSSIYIQYIQWKLFSTIITAF